MMRPSAFSSRQRSNGTSVNDVAAGNRGVDVARNQRELALERQVVEQHLVIVPRDRLSFRVVRQSAMNWGTARRGGAPLRR